MEERLAAEKQRTGELEAALANAGRSAETVAADASAATEALTTAEVQHKADMEALRNARKAAAEQKSDLRHAHEETEEAARERDAKVAQVQRLRDQLHSLEHLAEEEKHDADDAKAEMKRLQAELTAAEEEVKKDAWLLKADQEHLKQQTAEMGVVREELDFAHQKLRAAEDARVDLEQELLQKATELASLRHKLHEAGIQ